MEGQNAASATTLPEARVKAFKLKPIGVNPASVVQINTNVKCHCTNADVYEASANEYAKALAAANNGKGLDVAHGQKYLPINPIVSYLLGGRVDNSSSATGTGYAVNADGYVSKTPRPFTGVPPPLMPGSSIFYSVQSEADASRLLSGGGTWPAGPTSAHLGEGVYAWGSRVEAQAYLKTLKSSGVQANLTIVQLRINNANLSSLKSFIVPQNDHLANAWLGKYSSLYGDGLPHDFQYVQRMTGLGTEHYFSSDIFPIFKVK